MPKKAKKEQPIEVKIKAIRPHDLKRTYSNYIEVSANPVDVSLKFCDVKSPANQEEKEKVIKEKKVQVTIIEEIVIPRGIAESLLKALKEQLNKSEEKV